MAYRKKSFRRRVYRGRRRGYPVRRRRSYRQRIGYRG